MSLKQAAAFLAIAYRRRTLPANSNGLVLGLCGCTLHWWLISSISSKHLTLPWLPTTSRQNIHHCACDQQPTKNLQHLQHTHTHAQPSLHTMADQEEDFSSLPLPDRFTHKNWKVRKEGYEDAAKQFDLAQSENDPVVRQFTNDPNLWKGAVSDSNVAAQQEALGSLISYLNIAGLQGCIRSVVLLWGCVSLLTMSLAERAV